MLEIEESTRNWNEKPDETKYETRPPEPTIVKSDTLPVLKESPELQILLKENPDGDDRNDGKLNTGCPKLPPCETVVQPDDSSDEGWA